MKFYVYGKNNRYMFSKNNYLIFLNKSIFYRPLVYAVGVLLPTPLLEPQLPRNLLEGFYYFGYFSSAGLFAGRHYLRSCKHR